MLRSEVIQAAVNLFANSKYLEIGVSQGVTFHQVEASYKVAVDPRFSFDAKQARLDHPHCHYHEITSDQFFQNFVTQHHVFDVIFLDGLHTFEQTLRDLLNAIAYLKSDGVIVIDDVRPVSYSSSIKDEAEALMVKRLLPQESDGAWMGDVYRLVFFIESFLPAFSYATVLENSSHQLLLWRQQRRDARGADRTVETIAHLELCHILALQESYRAKPLAKIIDAIRSARSLQSTTEESDSEEQALTRCISCFPGQLYGEGGFYDKEVNLSDLLELEQSDAPDIEFISTTTPCEKYLHGDARVEGPDSAFNEQMSSIFRLVTSNFMTSPASAVVCIHNCIVSHNVILQPTSTKLGIVYETYRENDRPWARLPDPSRIDPESIPFYARAGRNVFYLGSVGSSNYGHWLVDDLPRLIALRVLHEPTTILVPSYGDPIDAVRSEAIRLLAPPEMDLKIEFIDPKVPLRFDSLMYVTPVSYHPVVKSPLAMNFVRSFGQALGTNGGGHSYTRLFLIRGADRFRKLLNVSEVSELLQALDFRVVDVEGMTFKEQAETFAGANTIVGVMGAAMTNTIFSPVGARTIYLAPNGWLETFYWDLSCALGHSYTVLYGDAQPASAPSGADFTIDCRKLEDLINDDGPEIVD